MRKPKNYLVSLIVTDQPDGDEAYLAEEQIVEMLHAVDLREAGLTIDDVQISELVEKAK